MEGKGYFMLCSQCGDELEKTDKVCKKCNNLISWEMNRGYTLHCEQCSSMIRKGMIRCPKCGNGFIWSETQNYQQQDFNANQNYFHTMPDFEHIVNSRFGQNLKKVRNSNWIMVGEVMGYIALVLWALVGGFIGMAFGGYDEEARIIGGIIGLAIGFGIGVLVVAITMIFVGIAKDIRDIRNKLCS